MPQINPRNKQTSNPSISIPQIQEVDIHSISVSMERGYDSNNIDSSLNFIDSMLTGKLGTRSAFTIRVTEVRDPEDKE